MTGDIGVSLFRSIENIMFHLADENNVEGSYATVFEQFGKFSRL